jgi:hypothetical protein
MEGLEGGDEICRQLEGWRNCQSLIKQSQIRPLTSASSFLVLGSFPSKKQISTRAASKKLLNKKGLKKLQEEYLNVRVEDGHQM